jgi:hypothetical protein
MSGTKKEMYSHHTWYTSFSTPSQAIIGRYNYLYPPHDYLLLSGINIFFLLLFVCTLHIDSHRESQAILNVHFILMVSQKCYKCCNYSISVRCDIKVIASFTSCWKCPTQTPLSSPMKKLIQRSSVTIITFSLSQMRKQRLLSLWPAEAAGLFYVLCDTCKAKVATISASSLPWSMWCGKGRGRSN